MGGDKNARMDNRRDPFPDARQMSDDEWLVFRGALVARARMQRENAIGAACAMFRRLFHIGIHEGRNAVTRGYWIVRVSVKDAARYPEYLRAAKPAFEKFGARFLVRGGLFEAMEGTARERNVVVEFDDYQTALACYRSAEYEAARAIRHAIADADFIIVEGAG